MTKINLCALAGNRIRKLIHYLSVIIALFTFEKAIALDNPTWLPAERVFLQGLDKVSAEVFGSPVYIDQRVNFGTLEIYVRAAYKTSPEDLPESVCFIEIYDNPPDRPRERVFSGWMFASNPALSCLEHSVYDIWIKEAIVDEALENSKPEDCDFEEIAGQDEISNVEQKEEG